MKIYTLTESERTLLKEAVDYVRKNPVNSPSRPGTDRSWSEAQDWLAPETYIAKPQGSIPPLKGLKPGVGRADIYYVNPDGELDLVDVDQWVYNLSTIAIDEDWIVINREKFGNWVAEACLSSD